MRPLTQICKLLLPILASPLCFAAQANRIAGPIDSSRMVVLSGQVHHNAQPQYDLGQVSGDFQLPQVTLLTSPSPAQQSALKTFLAEQQDRKSPNFHKWLTPEQYADQFGLSPADIKKISAWLQSQGLTVLQVARGRNWLVFSGTAAQIENAFNTEIHRYNVNGNLHYANKTAPSIPAALSGIAAGFHGLDDFRLRPYFVRKGKRLHPNYYDSEFQIPDFLAPGDIATIYDIQSLYNSAIDGTGQSMVIVGQTDVYLADLNAFRTGFGLTTISCTPDSSGVITASCNTSNFVYILDGADPGVASPAQGDLTEADLDLEWSAATARGAKIIYVNSTDVQTSYYYAIDQDFAPVISMSYGNCEFFDGTLASDEAELQEANSYGITFMNSSGDTGAANCDPGPETPTDNIAVYGLAVSYPAASPEVTAVGGTAISYPSGFSSTYWLTTNGTLPNGGTAQNPPLPETAWNDDVELGEAYSSAGTPLQVQESYAIVSSGGGVSNCSTQSGGVCQSGFAQPSWQTVTVPSQAAGRFLPDVSLLASPNFPGYVYCTPVEELSSTNPYDTETTSSCGTGTANDIATAVNGICNGACNGSNTVVQPSIVGGTSASSPIFAGIVTLMNQYLGGVGQGNINPMLYTLAAHTSNGAFHQVTTGENLVYCEGGTPSGQPAGLQCPGAVNTIDTIGYQASNADSTNGYNLVTGLGSVDAHALAVAWAAADAPDFQLMNGGLSPASVSAGSQTSTTITIEPVAGSTSTVVNFSTNSCTGLPAGASCSFNPSSVTFNNPSCSPTTTPCPTTTLTISTIPNMAIPSTPPTITIIPVASPNTTTGVTLNVTATTESFTLAATNGTTFPVIAGGTAQIQIAVSSASSPSFLVGSGTGATTAIPLTYTCAGSPNLGTAEISCAAPSNGQPTNATAVTVTLTTTGRTTQLHRPFSGSRLVYALLFPSLFGIVFAVGSRKRTVRLLSLIVVLGFCTVGLNSCGGGGNSGGTGGSNPGTPAGTYTVTVNATTGGASPLTSSTQVTLNVSQ
jgi:subtilase family serine protease